MWKSLSALSKELDIPYNTLNRYINRHESYLKIKREHKHFLINEECIPILLLIRELYLTGLNEKAVNLELLNRNVTITITQEDEKTEIQTLSASLQTMKEDIHYLRRYSEQQEKFNQELLMRLDQQQQYIKEHLEKRDLLLMQSLKESMQARKEVAATTNTIENKKMWWQFWK